MEGGGGDKVYRWLRKMRIRKGKMTERGQKKRGRERENGRRKKVKKKVKKRPDLQVRSDQHAAVSQESQSSARRDRASFLQRILLCSFRCCSLA